jgi:hypothetical protein
MFDFLRGDLTRINARLGAPERAKMDQYVESIRKMEIRLAYLADPTKQAACSKPGTPPATALRDANLEAVSAARLDIAVTAMLCGLTKVVAISFGSRGGGYPFLGNSLIGTHTMQHGKEGGGLTVNEMHKRCYNWHARNVKTVRERLGAAKEGNGSIMDSSIIAPWNATGTWHHRGPWFQYAWVIGNPGGYFGKMNKYKKYTQYTHSMSDVFVSVAKAMGVTPRNAAGTADRFGDERAPGPKFSFGYYTAPSGLVNTGPNPDLT